MYTKRYRVIFIRLSSDFIMSWLSWSFELYWSKWYLYFLKRELTVVLLPIGCTIIFVILPVSFLYETGEHPSLFYRWSLLFAQPLHLTIFPSRLIPHLCLQEVTPLYQEGFRPPPSVSILVNPHSSLLQFPLELFILLCDILGYLSVISLELLVVSIQELLDLLVGW